MLFSCEFVFPLEKRIEGEDRANDSRYTYIYIYIYIMKIALRTVLRLFFFSLFFFNATVFRFSDPEAANERLECQAGMLIGRNSSITRTRENVERRVIYEN